jgi:hypothetical protein
MLASYGLCYMIHGKTVARYSHPDFDMTRHAQGDGCIGWLEELCDVCAVLVTGGTHANRIVRPIVRETNEVKKGARPSFSTHQEESNELLFGPLRVRRGRKVTRGRSSDLRTEHTCRLVGGVGGPWPAVDRHDVHKDPASSAASRWTLANMNSKPPGSVQEKLGGQPLVEL